MPGPSETAPGDQTPGNERDGDFYRQLVEEGSDVTLLLDTAGGIRYASQAVERVLGHDPADLTGDTLADYVHPEDTAAVFDAIESLQTDQVTTTTIECRFRSADGTWYWLEAGMRSQLGTTLDGIIVTGRDVTEWKEREAELRTTKERMELALEGAKLGIWDWNMETGEVVRDELITDMLGYTVPEMGEDIVDWEEVVHPEGKRRHDEALADHIEKDTPYYQCEYRLRTNSGDWKWVRTMGKVVDRDGSGEPVRAVGIHQDIDDQKRTKLALEAERDMFEAGPAVVFKWEDAAGWPITYVSENVESVFGYTQDEIQSKDLLFADLVHEADIDRREREMTAYDTQDTDPFNPEPYRVRTAAGEVRWVMEYTKNLQEDGDENHLLGYIVDITERKRRERELEAREEKYRHLFEDTRDALMLMDRDGYRDCNEQALELFGVDSVEDFVEYSPWELAPPTQPGGSDSKEAALERIDEAVEEGEAFFEWTHQRVDGTEFPAEVKLSRFEYEGERVVQSLVRDITERKEQQQKLAAERNRIRAITNAIPDVTIVYDRQGRYREVLTGQDDLLVEDASELKGANVTDVLDREVAETIIEGIDASLATDTVQEVEYSLDLAGEQTWFEARIAPMTGGEWAEAVVLARDITDRKQHERELRAREEKYRNLFEDTRDALMLLNRDGFFDCNEQTLELFGIDSREEFLEYAPWEVSPPRQPDGSDSKEAALAHVETAFEDGEAFFEWTHQRVGGTEFPAEVKLSRFEHEGEPALHALVRDITERKEYERRIEAQRDNLDILNQVLRHDIRNDLQLILAYAELLEDECEAAEEQEYAETVIENADQAVELTKSAREMADVMLSAEKELHDVPLRGVLESEVEAMHESFPEADVSVEGSIPPVSVRANDMLESVFRNLLKNAVQHNDTETPKVTVSVVEPDDSVAVGIADNGPGVPDSQKEAIFGKGEKGLDSQGTGIGLYLVKTLVENYGGDIWVEDADGQPLARRLFESDDRPDQSDADLTAAPPDEDGGAVFIVELPTAAD